MVKCSATRHDFIYYANVQQALDKWVRRSLLLHTTLADVIKEISLVDSTGFSELW